MAEDAQLDGMASAVIVTTNVIKSLSIRLKITVEEDLLSEVDGVLRETGLDVPSAVRLFLTKVVQTRSIPFDLTASPRVVEVVVDSVTQARMEEVGAHWSRSKLRKP